jgi:hypothetical protein
MNLQSRVKKSGATTLNFQRLAAYFYERIFGQNNPLCLKLKVPFMRLSLFARRLVVCLCWGLFLAIPTAVIAQTNYYATNGTEYAIIGSLPGDQVFPDAAVGTNGGFVVWQDNITDGDGWGVSARQVDGTLSGTLGTFRVNKQGAGDQENPRVALLKNGGAVFVWQGGQKGFQHIYAAFVNANNVFVTNNDILVDTFTNNFQINPAVATLASGNVVVVWGSFDEAGSDSLQDVYGQILSPTGQKIGGEFLVNQQYTAYNQRTPALAALANGGFVVVWVSEQEQSAAPTPGAGSFMVTSGSTAPHASVGIDAQLYDASGNAQGGEFFVNTDSNLCANPDVAADSDGGFMVAWDEKDLTSPTVNSLDIYARSFTSAGAGSGSTVVRVNSHLYGDQYAPRVSSLGTDYLIVWTSMAQDGSREGVYGQFLRNNTSQIGGELRVNTTTINQQIQPVVASDGVSQFVTVWSSFTGSPYGFDLFAQRYFNTGAVLQPMAAPFVYAPFVISNGVYQPQLQVSWPPLLGLPVSNYEIYVDGATAPAGLTDSNVWTMTTSNGLATNSTHSFTVDYTTTDGRRSPISPSASGTTWSGLNYYGIPDEWMAEFFGGYSGGTYHTNFWPSANAPLAPGGPTLYQVFLSGGNPLDSSTWLATQLSNTPQGLFLTWNTQPGQTYQVQETTNFTDWNNLGSPRFAAGTSDSIFVGGAPSGYYRVVLLRQ